MPAHVPSPGRPSGRIVWLFAGLAAACAGCGDVDAASHAGGGDIVRRDSAGVTIVETPRSVLEALPVRRVLAAPAFVAGRADGPEEELFGSVSDATLLTADRIAIADAQATRIVVFDTAGAFHSIVGGEGAGPGEFRSVHRIAVIDDTLYVPDRWLGRIQRFSQDGEYIDSHVIAGSIGLQSGMEIFRPGRLTSPHAYRLTPNGFPRDVDEGDGPHPTVWVIGRLDSIGGARLDTLTAADGWYVDLSAEERRAATDAGLRHFSVGNVLPHPAAPDVRFTFLVDRPVVGWSSRPEIRVHEPDYTHAATFRLDLPVPRRSQDDARLREWTLQWVQPNGRPLARRAWNVLQPPDSAVWFHALRPGRDGHLWIAVGPQPADEADAPYDTRWLRLAPDGTPVEWVITPPGDVLELGPEAVLVLDTDELGVHRVAVHRYGER